MDREEFETKTNEWLERVKSYSKEAVVKKQMVLDSLKENFFESKGSYIIREICFKQNIFYCYCPSCARQNYIQSERIDNEDTVTSLVCSTCNHVFIAKMSK